MKFARFRPTGATNRGSSFFKSVNDFVAVWGTVAGKVYGVLKSIFGPIFKAMGFLSHVGAWAEKNKLNVHAKIVIGYVQVLGSFATFNVEWPEGLTTLMNGYGVFHAV